MDLRVFFACALGFCASAYAVPPDKMGEQWMGSGFELDYYFMLDENHVNHGKTGTLRCTVGSKQVVGDAEIDAIIKPLKTYGDQHDWAHMQPQPPEFYRHFALAPKNQLISYYQDPRAAARSAYLHDLTDAPQVAKAVEEAAKAICLREKELD